MVCGSVILAIAIAGQGRGEELSLSVDGVERNALIFAPSVTSEHPPVVFCFHGHTGTSGYASRAYDFQHAWPEAIVVYPQGLPTKTPLVDPEGKYSGWDMGGSAENRDIKFFDVLYRSVMDKYHGDSAHVFAMGHSNGGGFIYTLWATRASLFAGFASAEAGGARRFRLSHKPIFVTIGSRDPIVPPAYQHASLNEVLRINGNSGESQPFGGKAVTYPGKAPTVLWSYDGGHEFPRDSIEWMVKFFKSLTLS